MADSVDRVFVHALNTVKKIPKTGASRPPPADRLRLYGLYKQAMEGDVDGVMERPGSVHSGDADEDIETRKDRDKYDAWDAQKGISRTEAKKRYIEALIETMHKYASTTADARALVDELEFVWDQIKTNSVSSFGSSPGRHGVPSHTAQPREFKQPLSGADGPMRVLSPMSQNDVEERRSQYQEEYENNGEYNEGEQGKDSEDRTGVRRWRKTVEHSLIKMTAEIAALREQIATGREYRVKRTKTVGRWITWFLWLAAKHFLVDMVVLGIVLLWMRRRKDKRFEDLVREGLRIGREYVRKVVPAR